MSSNTVTFYYAVSISAQFITRIVALLLVYLTGLSRWTVWSEVVSRIWFLATYWSSSRKTLQNGTESCTKTYTNIKQKCTRKAIEIV